MNNPIIETFDLITTSLWEEFDECFFDAYVTGDMTYDERDLVRYVRDVYPSQDLGREQSYIIADMLGKYMWRLACNKDFHIESAYKEAVKRVAQHRHYFFAV